ncbi:hypothetical protein Xkhy_17120 [Xanthomonas axonopodis pv. khayae]|uniref:Uncharacterized protein n=1 Tax=Xanthomonas cassavae CFBP 4642 TaxID=1219375 RepID=A0ABS8HKS2_9XANT|nr:MULTISPECIES: hypothetical protein [Xanthomonas]OOX17557.1 hypothetical protein Xazr_11895 [Xanthomonas campestris pv. azadirachtae]HHZ28877.1 hypothetical protein [Xanthomonas vasicola pv. zeae]MCC4621906.1 hypothetical protein [Xanthomonas cassavae CFBP 4642]MCC5045660.1 hypothetical protein [Xanthomonas campestris]OOX12118.1 hypothetical protein Xkhy_17120 [Xanthomonas axonopodis pv. khayae]
MTDENTAELDALRERIAADGRWWRAVIGVASLIRERLVTPSLSRREYADDFAFLRIELAEAMTGGAALIEYGVRVGRDSHTVGVVTGRWTGTGLEDVRAWNEGLPCELAEAWRWIERGGLDEMPELRAAQRARWTGH